MKVECEVMYTELENEDGIEIESVVVTCARCGHQTESFGTGENSVKRCLALLREECPNRERNYYEADE